MTYILKGKYDLVVNYIIQGENMNSLISKYNAKTFLFLNGILWGSSYVWSKMLLSYLPRFTILFLSSLGGLISIIILYSHRLSQIKTETILPSIAISFFSIISNTFFILALQYTSSFNTAFIVQLSVIITPLIIAIYEKKLPEKGVVSGAIGALAGIFLLTCDLKNLRFNPGDLLALGNAVFFSLYLASMKINSNKIEPVHFTFIQHAVNTPVYLLMSVFLKKPFTEFENLKSLQFMILISISIIVTVSTILIQSSAIKYVEVEKAVIIYTIEPIAAMVLGFVFLGEKPEGFGAAAGCILIILSITISLYKKESESRRFTDIGQQAKVSPSSEQWK